MVPLSKYATVPVTATVFEAVETLEKAQEDYGETHYPHRAVLVYDEHRKIVGKVCQSNVIQALEPDFTRKLGEDSLTRFGISDEFIETSLDQSNFWKIPMQTLCRAAGALKVSDVMHSLTAGEFIRASAPLRKALGLMTSGCLNSLLVSEGDDVVGILRLTDVFDHVCREMKDGREPETDAVE
jgi:CBS-domain-containing membrane protein